MWKAFGGERGQDYSITVWVSCVFGHREVLKTRIKWTSHEDSRCHVQLREIVRKFLSATGKHVKQLISVKFYSVEPVIKRKKLKTIFFGSSKLRLWRNVWTKQSLRFEIQMECVVKQFIVMQSVDWRIELNLCTKISELKWKRKSAKLWDFCLPSGCSSNKIGFFPHLFAINWRPEADTSSKLDLINNLGSPPAAKDIGKQFRELDYDQNVIS